MYDIFTPQARREFSAVPRGGRPSEAAREGEDQRRLPRHRALPAGLGRAPRPRPPPRGARPQLEPTHDALPGQSVMSE